MPRGLYIQFLNRVSWVTNSGAECTKHRQVWRLACRRPQTLQISAREWRRSSYLEHKTNDWVRNKINFLVGPQEPLVATVKRQILAWFEHVKRHDSLSKIILQGTLEGGRHRGRHRKCWMNNVKQWTSLPIPELLTRASCRQGRERMSAESSLVSP